MTAEELATLGYQPLMGSPDLTQAASASSDISPADLQQFYAMAGNPNAGAPDPASLNPQPAFIDPALLDALGPQNSPQPASDPNGFTTGADLSAMGNPGSPGQSAQQPAPSVASNPATNPYVPGGTADQASGQSAPQQQQAAPKLSDFDEFMMRNKLVGIPLSEKMMLQAHKDFAEEQRIKLQAQLKQQDPEYQLGLKQKQQTVDANNPAALAAEQNSGAQAKIAAQFDTIAKDQATVQDTQRLLGQITTLANDKNLPSALGLSSVLPIVPGSARAGVQAKIDQLGGQAFLEAIPYLKGIGRITEMEAKNGTDAIARIKNTKQSPADYQQALSDFAAVVKNAQDRSQAAMLRNPAYPQYLASQKAIASTGQGSAQSPVTGSASASGAGAPLPQIVTIPANSPTGIPAGTYRVNANGKYVRVQ